MESYPYSTKKLKLPITGQVFGLGKTMFGLNLLDNRNTNVREILESDPILYKPLLTVSTIILDLQNNNSPDPDDVHLERYLSRMVFTNTLTQYFDISDSDATDHWIDHKYSLRKCVDVLHKLMPGRTLLYHIDEIGALDEKIFDGLFKQNRSPDDSLITKLVLSRYNEVWGDVTNMMRNGVLFYCSGKSLAFDEIGRGKLGNSSSYGTVERIDLSCFTVNGIVSILGNTKMDITTGSMITVTDYLGVSNDNVQKLGDWIYKLTSGIPRLVIYMLECLFENKFTFQFDKDKLVDDNDVLERQVFKAIIKAPGCMPPNYMNGNMFKTVLSYAAMEYEFKDGDFLPRGDAEMDYTAAELALQYRIYTSGTSPGKFKYIMPLLWRKRALLPYIKPWDFLNNYSNGGKVPAFERLFVDAFKFHCYTLPHSAICGAYFPYLAHTCVKDCAVYDPNYQELTYNVSKGGADLEELQNDDLKKATSKDYHEDTDEVKIILKLLSYTHHTFFTPMDKASSPDFIQLLPLTSMTKVRKLVMYQLKNESNALTIKNIQKELNKCKLLVAVSRKGKEESEPNNAVFVMMHTGPVDDDVRDKLVGKVVDVVNNTTTLIIPKGLEVVVICADKVPMIPPYYLNLVKNLKN